MIVTRFRSLALLGLLLGACSNDTTSPSRGFLQGTDADPQIALVVNSLGKSLTLFQLGKPSESREIPFGASSAVTPTGLAVRGTHAAVPLGNAASVALVDLTNQRIERFYTFAQGNATGVAFVDDNTIVAANLTANVVGKATVQQTGTELTNLVPVAPVPTAVAVSQGKVFVVSGNLDENFAPIGPGIVTVIDPTTMTPIDTIETGGTNSSAVAVGPDGKIYVVNTEDFVSDGSVTVIDPATLQVVGTYHGFGAGPGAIKIDSNGLAYVSGFFTGTLVWNTATHAFVRDIDHPVCARLTLAAGTPCRGAFDATRASDGSIYQVFFGSPSQGLPPYIFVFSPTYELKDSVSVGAGSGPASIDIGTFNP